MVVRSSALLLAGAVLAAALIGIASISTTPDSSAGIPTPTPTASPLPANCEPRAAPPPTSPPTPYNLPAQPFSTYRDIRVHSTVAFCNDDSGPASKLRIHFAYPYSSREVTANAAGCPEPELRPVNRTADEFDLIVDWRTPCVDPVDAVTLDFSYASHGADPAPEPFCYTWFNENDEPLDAGGSCPLIPSILSWGKIDCKGSTGFLIGAVLTLRGAVGLPYDHRNGCPDANTPIVVDDFDGVWGDFDCDGAFTPKDALLFLLAHVGLTPQPGPGCPAIGAQVAVSF